MVDVHSKEVRSFNMSRIKGKNTKPEMIIRQFLFAQGFRFRLHDKSLAGKPDLVFPRYKKVLFVHGCYWHGHEGCKYYVPPKTRADWWLKKIEKTKTKNSHDVQSLIELGWNVVIIWECQLKPIKKLETLNALIEILKS